MKLKIPASILESKIAPARKGLVRSHSASLVELSRVIDSLHFFVCLGVASFLYGVPWDKEHFILSIVAVAFFSISASFNRLYRSWRTTSFVSEIGRIFICWFMSVLGAVLVIYLNDSTLVIPQEVINTWFEITLLMLVGTRASVRLFLRVFRASGRNVRTAAIVGATEIGQQMAQTLKKTSWMGMDLVGIFDDRKSDGKRPLVNSPVPVEKNIADLVELAETGKVDFIYVALPMRAEIRIKSLIDRLVDTTATIYYVPDFSTFDLLHSSWDYLGGFPVISIVDTPFQGLNAFVKRLEDIVIGSIIVSLILIPMILIGIGIKLTSRGPVIYRQKREGIYGEKFIIWKFRTLTVTDDDASFRQVQANDSRLTPFGAFLRRTSLDELPQFINVLQGRMSIVGPRPHTFPLNEKHRKLVHRYMLRHKVKPGITGWAQVNNCRGETNTLDKMERRIQYDLEYIHNWSLWLDLKIIFQTIWKGFRSPNAF